MILIEKENRVIVVYEATSYCISIAVCKFYEYIHFSY